MAGTISAVKILDIALEAADRAMVDSDEHKLTAKDIGYLNEQWTSSYVGDAVSRYLRKTYDDDQCRPFVTYETTVSWLEYFFEQRRKSGPIPGKLSDRQRFDIAIWTKKRHPIGLVEIKNEPVMSGYSRTADPKKLLGALRRWDDLRWGLFLFCTRNNTQKEGRDLQNHLTQSSDRTVNLIASELGSGARISSKSSKVIEDDGKQILWSGVIIRPAP